MQNVLLHSCVCVLGKLNRGDNLSLPVIPGWDPVQYGMGHSDAVFFLGQMEWSQSLDILMPCHQFKAVGRNAFITMKMWLLNQRDETQIQRSLFAYIYKSVLLTVMSLTLTL